MELRNFFTNSSNKIYTHNMDLLEEYDLINPLGSPNKLFLKFLNSKKLGIKKDKITADLIQEFEDSIDSINIRLAKVKKQKEIIIRDGKVWINLLGDEGLIGCDLILDSDKFTIKLLNLEILYSQVHNIDVTDGSWSKQKFIIKTSDDEIIFEINEDKARALKEILDSNVAVNKHDELDDLLELYELYAEGKISDDELEIRKAIIYSDDKYCVNCGFRIEEDSEYCSNCGCKV